MRAHIRLARSSPGPVEADWQTDAYVAERRRRLRAYHAQPNAGDDVRGESRAAGSVSQPVAEPAATRIRDDRRPRWYERGPTTTRAIGSIALMNGSFGLPSDCEGGDAAGL